MSPLRPSDYFAVELKDWGGSRLYRLLKQAKSEGGNLFLVARPTTSTPAPTNPARPTPEPPAPS